MGSTITSSIKILDNRVIESRVFNHELDLLLTKGDKSDIDLSIAYRFQTNEEHKNVIKLDMQIKVLKEGHDSVLVDLLNSTVFEFGLEDEEWIKYAPNMMSMTFPYIRAYISGVTALAGIQPLVLPAVNVYEILENANELE